MQNHRRATFSYVHCIQAAPEVVFPLLCPVREHDYLPDWRADILYSESGVAEEGCIFVTRNREGAPTIWCIIDHDAAAGRIRFVTFTPESRVGQLDIKLEPDGDMTAVTFTYTHTAVSPEGEAYLAELTEERFREKMAAFEASLNGFIRERRDPVSPSSRAG